MPFEEFFFAAFVLFALRFDVVVEAKDVNYADRLRFCQESIEKLFRTSQLFERIEVRKRGFVRHLNRLGTQLRVPVSKSSIPLCEKRFCLKHALAPQAGEGILRPLRPYDEGIRIHTVF